MTSSKHGYTLLSSTLDYQNPYMRIYKREFELPDGKKNTYWTAERGSFSIIIPLFEDQTTILVGQYRLPVDCFSWEFPMGFVKGETFLNMAKQELVEEAGYTANKWDELGNFYLANGWYENSAIVFVAKDLSFSGKQPEETEFLKTKRCTLEEVANMIADGIIKDGPTIVAYHYLERYLQK